MEIKEIKQINITIVFSEPLNHLLITPQRVLDLFKRGDRVPQHSLIEGPGLKVFIFPELQKDLVFELHRVLVNDKSGVSIDKSEVVDYLYEILKEDSLGINRGRIIAYGFNYDILITPLSGLVNFTDFVGTKISQVIDNIEEAGIRTIFHKENVRFDFQITPVGKEKLIAHLNVEYRQPLPEREELKDNLSKQFKYLISLIKAI